MSRKLSTYGPSLIVWGTAIVVLLVAIVVLSRAETAREYEYVVACYGEIRPSTPTLSYCTNRWKGSAAAVSLDTLFGWLGAAAVGLTLLLRVITWFWAGARKDIEESRSLGDTNGMIHFRYANHGRMADADLIGLHRRRGQEEIGRRAMRVLLQKMMLDRPRRVEAKLVRESDLLERILDHSAFDAPDEGARHG